MKKTIDLSDFRQAFRDYDRIENFSYEGLESLFEYLEEMEEETGEELGLDVIALCCYYSEYENLDAFQADYGEEYQTIDDIEQETTVIRINDESFIIQAF